MSGRIAQAREGRILFVPAIPCVTAQHLTASAEEIASWPVDQKVRDNRRAGTKGLTLTWPPGEPGVWCVQHDDGTVGAYLPEEVEDDG